MAELTTDPNREMVGCLLVVLLERRRTRRGACCQRREYDSRRIELYEPAMCCETGVCGPAVDQQLVGLREDLRWAQAQGRRRGAP